jgi:hypothetical protein
MNEPAKNIADEITEFLKRAAAVDRAAWFNIHHRMVFADGRLPIFPGTAHQTINTALNDAMYWAQRGNDVYLARGIFREAGPKRQGKPYPSALRQGSNLIACNSMHMDMDVKDGAYACTNDALAALKAFYLDTRIPTPTTIVGSGSGGLHIYWLLITEIEPSEFRRMAAQLVTAGTKHGLLFDEQCTTDAIRLLRILGTWNFKGGEGAVTPVTLRYMAPHDIDTDVMRKALNKFKTVPYLRVVHSESKPSVNDDLIGEPDYPPPPQH